jgi:hypothetical protein
MKYLSRALALTSLLILILQRPAIAEPWKILWDVNVTVTQNAYSDSWASGESGSLNWVANSNTVAEKQLLARVFNKNTLKLAYGVTYRQDPDSRRWDSGDNSTDLVDFESTYRLTLQTAVEPIFAFRLISQFRDESDPFKDRWFNPMELTESIGISRVFIKEETREWQTRIGIAAKQTIDRDVILDPTNPASPRETQTQYEEGIELVNDLKTPLADDRITWISKLTVFQGLLNSEKDTFKGTPAEDDWRYPDINFENTFTSNVTTYIAVNLYVQMLYDRQIDRRARFKQTLSLALTYKIM